MTRGAFLSAGGTVVESVVLVTGGTGYLGTSVCKAFAEARSRVVAAYLLDQEIPYFEKTLESRVRKVSLIKADVTKPGEMKRIVKEVISRFKRVDVLVNTVGGYMSGPVGEVTDADFERAMGLNLKSAVLACQAVVPAMRRARRGKIVNVSSEASLLGDEGSILYSASKAGVNRLTEALARELKEVNVQVNCVMPRVLDTPANRKAMPDADVSSWVKTDQVARVIRWLCSEEADPISGAAIPVYGGP